MENFFDEFEDYQDNLTEREVEFIQQCVPEEGLILQVIDNCGNTEDMITGLKEIKAYIAKVEHRLEHYNGSNS